MAVQMEHMIPHADGPLARRIRRHVSASETLETKIEAQPKPSSKRIENVSLAPFFGRLWDPVHLKQPFTMEHLNWPFKHSFAAAFLHPKR